MCVCVCVRKRERERNYDDTGTALLLFAHVPAAYVRTHVRK